MGEGIAYKIVESDRAKRLRIAVYPGEKVVVTKPRAMRQELVDAFVSAKQDWIEQKLGESHRNHDADLADDSYKHFLFNRGKARQLVKEKLAHWNKVYNFEYRRISIKQLKSRWGSCSTDGNLSFNYKLLFLDEDVQDYVIVHELCHLKELNHSDNFWALVGLALPKYRHVRRVLKKLG